MGDVEAAAPKRTPFYRNRAFFGVLIGVAALIVVVIVCLLLVAFRGGRIDLDKFHGNGADRFLNSFLRAASLLVSSKVRRLLTNFFYLSSLPIV